MEVEEEKLHTDKGILDRCRVLPLYRSRLEEKKKKYVNELDPSLMRREKERDHEHGLKKMGGPMPKSQQDQRNISFPKKTSG